MEKYGHWWKSITVLHGVDVNVPTGIIYGLLGPSGCEIIVFDKRPGTHGHRIPGRAIGYMPQETALYRNFSISEMLHHFGRLHNMKRRDILSREEFLISLLDLPSKTKQVSQLSGGQQRRVSLVCALLQQPQLLILDEPTVGVDPILQEKIWSHLIYLSQTSKTTIMITTHYIEEARKANRVGLMRSGRMLAEDEPNHLVNQYNEISLENVFLRLCYEDQNCIQQQTTMNNIDGDCDTDVSNNINEQNLESTYVADTAVESLLITVNRKQTSRKNFIDYFKFPHIHKIYALIMKDLTLVKRNISLLIFQFLIPVIQISLFCLCIGRNAEHISMALYNGEAVHGFPTGNLSLQLLNKINPQQIDIASFNDFNKAMDLVKQGQYWGVIAIQDNFTQAVKNKVIDLQTDSATRNASSLHLYLDMTTDPPVIIENPVYGSLTPKFINFAAPGMVVSIIFFLATGLTGLIFVVEKKQGLLERSWIAGVTTIEVMFAHIIVKFFIRIIQIILLLTFTDYIFKIEIKGSIFLAAGIIFLQGICGMSYGLLISSMCDEEMEVMQVALGSIFPVLICSGIMWPLEGMPSLMRYISNFTPLTHTVEAMRCIAARSRSLTHFKVWFGFVNASSWSLGFFIIAAIIFALRK
ncbi:unnamed protein product [Rotaria sp. Silwood1]|nr:unnamed protein product [Rotaria sp. Silwood1]